LKDWSLPVFEPNQLEDKTTNVELANKEVKYYTSYVPGIKQYLKNLGSLRHKHKLIDSELDRNDTRRGGVKRAILKFEKKHLLGYTLVQEDPAPSEVQIINH